jgi:hypothetical protein
MFMFLLFIFEISCALFSVKANLYIFYILCLCICIIVGDLIIRRDGMGRNESGRFGALKSDSTHHFFKMPVPSQGHYGFSTVFRLLTDLVCLYTYEFWLSLCKIVRSSVILLLHLSTYLAPQHLCIWISNAIPYIMICFYVPGNCVGW